MPTGKPRRSQRSRVGTVRRFLHQVKRGDLYSAIPPGDYGKPRPVVIVQSDLFAQRDSVTVCLLSSTLIDAPLFRVRLAPGPHNKLRKLSDVMVDKIMTVKRSRLASALGSLTADETAALDQALARWLALPTPLP